MEPNLCSLNFKMLETVGYWVRAWLNLGLCEITGLDEIICDCDCGDWVTQFLWTQRQQSPLRPPFFFPFPLFHPFASSLQLQLSHNDISQKTFNINILPQCLALCKIFTDKQSLSGRRHEVFGWKKIFSKLKIFPASQLLVKWRRRPVLAKVNELFFLVQLLRPHQPARRTHSFNWFILNRCIYSDCLYLAHLEILFSLKIFHRAQRGHMACRPPSTGRQTPVLEIK